MKFFLLFCLLIGYTFGAAISKSAVNSNPRSLGNSQFLDWDLSYTLHSTDSLVLTQDSAEGIYFESGALVKARNVAPDSIKTCFVGKRAGVANDTVRVLLLTRYSSSDPWVIGTVVNFALSATQSLNCTRFPYQPREYLRPVLIMPSDSATIRRAFLLGR